MRIEQDLKLDFSDVLIRPKRTTLTSRSQVQLTRTFKMLHSHNQWSCVPIVAANMDGVGTFRMATELAKFDMTTALHKHYSVEELVDIFVPTGEADYARWANLFYTVGVKEEDYEKLQEVTALVRMVVPGPDWQEYFPHLLCIDVANGYMEKLIERVKFYRTLYSKSIIVAGNVVTAEMTENLISAGADIVKVGIGSGSACTTRSKTGVGYPQLSAIIECADAAHGMGGYVMSDGGCKEVGDIAKAFGAGADFVMLGGMLAGHDEGDATKTVNGRQFYGMSSEVAQDKHNGGLATYRAAEGKTIEVPDRGPVKDTLQEILGGLRSCCTYVGAKYLKQLPKCTTFVRVCRQKDD